MIIEFPNGLKNIVKKHKGKKIVYATGCFDLTHAGHILFLESCKALGDILLVQVASDKSIKVMKGRNRPVFNEHIRIKIVDSLKPVDYCFLDGVGNFEESLKIQKRVLKEISPYFYAVNDDASDIILRRKLVDRYGVKMVVLKRFCPKEYENISTTKIIRKIRNS